MSSGRRTLEARLEAVAVRARERLDELTDRVVAALDPASSPGELPDSRAELVRDAAARMTALYLDVIADRRRLTPSECSAVEGQVRGLAAAGLDDYDVQTRIRAGAQAAWRFVAEVAGGVAKEDTARVLAELFADSIDFYSDVREAVSCGYRKQREQALTAEARAREDLVDELVAGPLAAPDGLQARAARLGHDLACPHGLLLVTVTATGVPAERLRSVTASYVDRVPDTLESSLHPHPVPHVVVLVPAPSPAAWDAALREAAELAGQHILVVAAHPVVDLIALAPAYEQARAGLALASRRQRAGVVELQDVAAEQLVAALGSLHAHQVLNPAVDRLLAVPASKREVLLGTLAALWAADGPRAGRKPVLPVSERTVRRHMQRLRELTGLDVDHPADRWFLEAARHALWVFGDEPAGRAPPPRRQQR